MTPFDPEALAARYVAVWSEPDPELRRKLIRELWSDDGTHVLQPPQELREIAARVGFPAAVLEARGHDALDVRVARAYEDFIGTGRHRFRARGDAERLHDVVKFHWEMVETDGGAVAGVGLEILILDDEGRIARDYQFIE
jgi:hypothetical protein